MGLVLWDCGLQCCCPASSKHSGLRRTRPPHESFPGRWWTGLCAVLVAASVYVRAAAPPPSALAELKSAGLCLSEILCQA